MINFSKNDTLIYNKSYGIFQNVYRSLVTVLAGRNGVRDGSGRRRNFGNVSKSPKIRISDTILCFSHGCEEQSFTL